MKVTLYGGTRGSGLLPSRPGDRVLSSFPNEAPDQALRTFDDLAAFLHRPLPGELLAGLSPRYVPAGRPRGVRHHGSRAAVTSAIPTGMSTTAHISAHGRFTTFSAA